MMTRNLFEAFLLLSADGDRKSPDCTRKRTGYQLWSPQHKRDMEVLERVQRRPRR